MLQGAGGTTGTPALTPRWRGLLLPDLAECWMLSPAPGDLIPVTSIALM